MNGVGKCKVIVWDLNARLKYERIRKGFRRRAPAESGGVLLFVCVGCGKKCLSHAGMVSHQNSHHRSTRNKQ